jgi:excisionase family DNA binding protein
VRRRSSLTTGEAARHCEVSVAALQNWVRGGVLPARKTPGGHYRIDLQTFQRFLREHGMRPYPVPSSDIRILIADDEAAVVDLLVQHLSRDSRGFRLETATDGYDALIKIGAFHPSVLILDVVMPRVDGIEVCRRLKASPETRGIRILGITGYPDMIPALLEVGADACLTKPVTLQRVRDELERLLVSWAT